MKKFTFKALVVFTLLSITAPSLAACAPEPTKPPPEVEVIDEVIVHIPDGGMYEEGEVSIERVDVPQGADTQTFRISGNPYDISVPGEYFRLPVEIEIPYNPNLLPENRTEAEVFPVYYFEGVWYRAEGEVDSSNNTIRVTTLHNGEWDWAWDIVDNWAGPEKVYFCENNSEDNLRQARENAEQARLDLLNIIEDAEMKVEEIDAPTDYVVDLVGDNLKEEGAVFILEGLAEVFRGKTSVRFIFGGKSAVIHIGGTKIATLLSGGATAIKTLGVVGTAIVFYKQGEAIGETSAQIFRIATAYKRFKEAKALVWGLENGCYVLSMPPEYEETLKDIYAEIPIDQTTGNPIELDLEFSMYSDLENVVELTEPTYTPEPTQKVIPIDPHDIALKIINAIESKDVYTLEEMMEYDVVNPGLTMAELGTISEIPIQTFFEIYDSSQATCYGYDILHSNYDDTVSILVYFKNYHTNQDPYQKFEVLCALVRLGDLDLTMSISPIDYPKLYPTEFQCP